LHEGGEMLSGRAVSQAAGFSHHPLIQPGERALPMKQRDEDNAKKR
jgi:hypothetical protein